MKELLTHFVKSLALFGLIGAIFTVGAFGIFKPMVTTEKAVAKKVVTKKVVAKKVVAKKVVAKKVVAKKVVAKKVAMLGGKAISQNMLSFLELIADGEGTSDEKAKKFGFSSGYEISYKYGRYLDDEISLTDLTFGEIKKIQKEMLKRQRAERRALRKKIASGKYSGKKLRTLKRRYKHFIFSSAVGKFQFTRETLNEYQKKCGFSDKDIFSPSAQNKMAIALLGDLGLNKLKRKRLSVYSFQRNLSRRWASIAHPKTGKSFYGQRVGVSNKKMRWAIKTYLV